MPPVPQLDLTLQAIQETLMQQRQETPPMAVLNQVIHPERKFAVRLVVK
jgi:hypothetical protein